MDEVHWSTGEYHWRIDGLVGLIDKVFVDTEHRCQPGLNHVSVFVKGTPVVDVYLDNECIAVYNKDFLGKARDLKEHARSYAFKVVKVGEF